MKITRYPQSCLLVETKNEAILVDVGTIDFSDSFYTDLEKADYILITHKHSDHCHEEVIKNLMSKKDIKLYSSNEVKNNYPSLNIDIIKEGDVIDLGKTKIEVVHAEHGYIPKMKGNRVMENVGYIINDGEKRLYITSDSICFENDYKCDILAVGVSDYGITMGAFEASEYTKDLGASFVLPIHLDNPLYPVDYTFLDNQMKRNNINYKVLAIGESIEL